MEDDIFFIVHDDKDGDGLPTLLLSPPNYEYMWMFKTYNEALRTARKELPDYAAFQICKVKFD